jgi:MHS family citrate/tricarballylate:H+ symporter-like MFS transporter
MTRRETFIPVTEPKRPLPLRHAFAVFIGNGLEFYDFVTYGFFAVYIGRTFFPSADASLSLLGSLGTFGAGFVTRPIGAMILGPLGDRIGRKPVMVLTFLLMGIGVAGLCLTPSYAQIGVAAPLLVLVFRLVQGFALGGEVGPSTAYMIEAAPPHRRGLYGAMQYLTQDASITLAGIVGWVLAYNLSDQQLQDWGWRAAMGLGVMIIPFGLWLRSHLPETMQPPTAATRASRKVRLREILGPHTRVLICGLLILTAGTIGNYTVNYMTTYALAILHLSSTTAFGTVIVSGCAGMLMDLTGGWLSDRFGRKPIMLYPMIALVILILPAFWLINRYPGMATLYTASSVLMMLLALGSISVLIMLSEQLPMNLRCGAVAIVYAFAVSIFGGSTQFMETWLIRITGSPMAPAWYWLGAAVVGLLAVSLIRESAPTRVGVAADIQSETEAVLAN